MRTLVLGGIVAVLAALSGTAMADPAAATSAPAPQATAVAQTTPAATPAATADADLDRVVCQSEPPPTGTRLGARHTCHTQREWDRMRQEQQNHLTRVQSERGMYDGH